VHLAHHAAREAVQDTDPLGRVTRVVRRSCSTACVEMHGVRVSGWDREEGSCEISQIAWDVAHREAMKRFVAEGWVTVCLVTLVICMVCA
jgi:hypothetical protein